MLIDEILEYAMKRTSFKAKQVIGTHGFIEADYDDLQQDLLADILHRLPKFDGDRASLKTFISRLIDNRIASLIKYQTAACRDHRNNECSLDDWVRDEIGSWVRRDTTIEEDIARAHVNQTMRSRQEQLELAMDVASVLDSLPANLRNLCTSLQSQTVMEISRATGVSRSRLYEQIKLIRRAFSDAGLRDYL